MQVLHDLTYAASGIVFAVLLYYHVVRVLLHGRLTDGWLVQGPFGSKRAHLFHVWARVGPARAHAVRETISGICTKKNLTNQPCTNLPSISTRLKPSLLIEFSLECTHCNMSMP